MGFALNMEDILAIIAIIMCMDLVVAVEIIVIVVKLAELSEFAINTDFIMARNSARLKLKLEASDRHHMNSLIADDR